VTVPSRPWAAELLHFWFHELAPEQWFARNDDVDAALRRRFAHDLAAMGARPAREFLGDPLTARAAVLLFDQVPRNAWRDTAEAFATDVLALAIARDAVAAGLDAGLDPDRRTFLYMPFQHSESIDDQRESLRLFSALGDDRSLRFAQDHYAMIERFGRFPHRNAALGRRNRPGEAEAVAEGSKW